LIFFQKSHIESLNTILIKWYKNNNRDLSIRETQNPYYIWLSEVILQQTRMDQGLPYYHNFISVFPTIQLLAAASEKEILRLWQGLGYYSRARNLHKCARFVVKEFDGVFPEKASELERLPGVGPYTAAAIASFAYKEPVATVDGNVLRLFTRLFGIEDDIRKNKTIGNVRKLANQHIDKKYPDLYNHALMDFGNLVCKPYPSCQLCPLKSRCYAYANDLQKKIPYKSRPAKQRHRFFHYLVIKSQNQIAMKKRMVGDIWANLYDFSLSESSTLLEPHELKDPVFEKLEINHIELLKDYKHVLSHQIIHARFILVSISKNEIDLPELQFYTLEKIMDLPKPVLIDKFLSDFFKSSIQIDNFIDS